MDNFESLDLTPDLSHVQTAQKSKKTLVFVKTSASIQDYLKNEKWELQIEPDLLKKILPRGGSLITKSDAYFPTNLKKLKKMRE